MKNEIIIISALILLISCKSTNLSVKADAVKQETLIAIESKVYNTPVNLDNFWGHINSNYKSSTNFKSRLN